MKKSTFCMAAAVLCAGCQSTGALSPEARDAAVIAMKPEFECVIYFDQAGERELVSKGIDDAVTIGEKRGMQPNEIMRVYRGIRTEQQDLVLDKALEFSSQRKGGKPTFSGGPPPPNLEEQSRAWAALYSEQCDRAET